MMSEISVPLLLTLLCEVTPLLLSISAVAAGVHEATSALLYLHWDQAADVWQGLWHCARAGRS
jgi:hypothetical protein